jgi:hypothetical protein
VAINQLTSDRWVASDRVEEKRQAHGDIRNPGRAVSHTAVTEALSLYARKRAGASKRRIDENVTVPELSRPWERTPVRRGETLTGRCASGAISLCVRWKSSPTRE